MDFEWPSQAECDALEKAKPAPGKYYNRDHRKSARVCGCDEGANHTCAECKKKAITNLLDVSRRDMKPIKGLLGIGGAPTRATTLPTDAALRKQYPIATGVLDYFPDAIVALAQISWKGNEQHNPGQPLHWNRSKSSDEDDTVIRHFMQRGTRDEDGTRHSAKFAWRALAFLQKEIEAEQAQEKAEFDEDLGTALRYEEELSARGV